MKQLVTPKQVARAIGVSESSLKRWCDKGILPTVRTAGGHRRIPTSAVIQYLRESGQTLVDPALLGLPSATGQGPTAAERATQLVQQALIDGQDEVVRQTVLDLYLAGLSACDICDKVLAEAFRGIGHEWEGGRLAVYRERRACEVTTRVLHELRSALPVPGLNAPYAVGGTVTRDGYVLPTTMIELTMRELGWRAESFGIGLPVETFCAAIRDIRPALAWLSVSHVESVDDFLADYAEIYRTATEHQVALVVGGRALDDSLRPRMRYSAYCDTLRHLAGFVATLGLPTAPALATS